jgi:dephospho-CoA kinase
MKTILITGMSGTGKSTTILNLLSCGYNAVDLDTDAFSTWTDADTDSEYPDNEVKPGKDWVWHEERVLSLLSDDSKDVLFVSGCASNMGKFYSYFEHIILLTAPEALIVQRLESRGSRSYGHSPEEVARILRLKQSIEPLLRNIADLEIDTSMPCQSTIELIVQHTGTSRYRNQ